MPRTLRYSFLYHQLFFKKENYIVILPTNPRNDLIPFVCLFNLILCENKMFLVLVYKSQKRKKTPL